MSPPEHISGFSCRLFHHIMLWVYTLPYLTGVYYAHIYTCTGDNNLKGTLPRDLPYLNQLERLNLTRNPGLTGTLPPEIGELTFLKVLDLYDNSFEGTIPTSFGNLVEITSFRPGK